LDKFSHGGDRQSIAKELNCEVDEIIDLSSNINFIKPKIDIDFNTLAISSYPTYDKLYDTISKHYDVYSNQIELFNGASSAIFSLFRYLDNKTCYIYSPAYLEYKKSAQLFNYNIKLINRFTNIEYEVEKDSLIVFVNPSTPDGAFYDIDTLMKMWIDKNCTIIIDESFLEFTYYNSIIHYIKKYDKLYIIKSMTKFYSSAGIRIGAILSSKDNIANIKKTEPLWKISQFDQNYIMEVLKDKDFGNISREINIKNKNLLTNYLLSSKYISKIYPSDANYILVELKSINAKEFQNLIKPHKIIVRDCSNFDFLDDNFIRIAIKSEEDIMKLINAIKIMKLL